MKFGKNTFYRKSSEFVTSTNHTDVYETKLQDGVNMLNDFIVWRQKDTIKVYDRICDHNGGRLITNQGRTTCPLHGWEFDPKSGDYLNIKCHKTPLYDGPIHPHGSVSVPLKSLQRKLENFKSNVEFKIRFLNHACLVIDCGEIKFATDPWIFGSAFSNGWWLANPSPNDSLAELNSCDFIYISHNHPDHLHPQTLSEIRKDIPIVTASFDSNSTVSMLTDLKFKFVNALKFDEKWVMEDDELAFSILKSGDFRDDSGLLIEIGNKTVLLTVDSNFLDFWRFPEKIDLLASSFAGGASGFPLCFETVEPERKLQVIARNRRSAYTTNKMVLQKIKPKAFLPYAGFFTEKAKRDCYIRENNKKNTIDDYADLCQNLDIRLIDATKTPIISMTKSEISTQTYPSSLMYEEAPEIQIFRDELENVLSEKELAQYFENCNFCADLDLLLLPVNNDFENPTHSCFIKFQNDGSTIISFEKEFERRTDVNFLQIKTRKHELAKVVQRGLPWEDLSIGFQCRIYREPDIYNVNFWHHFTNVYINDNVRRRTKDCNGCEVIAQQL